MKILPNKTVQHTPQKTTTTFLWSMVATLFLFACNGTSGPVEANFDKVDPSKVRIHTLGDVKHLNVVTASDNQSTIIAKNTHQMLYDIDPKTYEYLPVLAKERAKVSEDEEGRTILDFEIRPEAQWDNGSPITAKDIIYNLKLIFTPDIETVDRLKPYMDYISDIKVDPDNPKKFRVICGKPYMSAETSISNNLIILPQYIYDPEGVMDDYPLKDLLDEKKGKELQEDKKLKEYAQFFNSNQFKYDVMEGSGPYKFTKWDTNERLVVTRKKDWWGDKVDAPNNAYFTAIPEQIIYTTITDLNTAVIALRGQDVDAMQSVPNKQFVEEMQNDESFKAMYDLATPPLFAYDYIGINTRDPRMADVKVRKALAHAMNVEQVINSELYGLGEQMINIIHPLFEERFNKNIEPYQFSLQKSKELLKEAGWADSNGNGILDKEIDGELQELQFTILTNNGNDRRKTTALIFQNGLKQIGVQLDVQVMEWASFLDKLRKRDFDLYVGGWAFSPAESDPAQIWHSRSYADGSNYTGFGTPESDALIDELRRTVDDEKRFELYKKLQRMIHDDVPYIFTVVQKNRVAMSKAYNNTYGTGLRQGFVPRGFSPAEKVTAE